MRWVNLVHCYQPPDWPHAMLDRVVRESYRPFFAWLVDHPSVRLTVNVTGSLGEQLTAHGYNDVLVMLGTLLDRGQITCTATAMYHTLLPLLPATEARRQLALQARWFRATFPNAPQPRGVFLPELAFAPSFLPELGDAHQWFVLDEICDRGTLGTAMTDRALRMAGSAAAVFYRNRIVSDYLFLFADLAAPATFWEIVARDGRSNDVLITAMDVENFGHHRPHLDRFWQTLVTDPRVTTCTVDDALEQALATTSPVAGSWSSQEDELRAGIPYALWRHPDNAVHRAQWQLTDLVVTTVQRYAPENTHPARSELDRALASDQYWWASAEPWWDGTLITRGADRLLHVLTALGVRPEELQPAIALQDAVRTAVAVWERSGIPAARSAAYLARHKSRRRLGGDVMEATSL